MTTFVARGFTRANLKALRAKLGPSKTMAAPNRYAEARYAATVNLLCDANQLPRPVAEFTFHPTRKWRSDFCWPAERVVLEVDGGVFTSGRHTRGSGWLKDAEKRRAYAALGYLVIPVTPTELHAGVWVESAREAMRWSRIKETI